MKTSRRLLVDEGVQYATRHQYELKTKRLEAFREELNAPWSEELFIAFLREVRESGLKEAESFRSALLHHLTREGKDTDFLRTEAVRKATEGIRLQHAIRDRPQGTITEAMFEEWVTWLRGKGELSVAIFSTVIYCTQLRISEACDLRVGDAQVDADGGLVTLRKDKRVTRRRMRNGVLEKHISKKTLALYRRLEGDRGIGDYLFPEGHRMAKRIRELLKEAARVLKWPTGVEFRGPHAFRHGGTALLKKRARKAVEEGMAHQSGRTVRHYGKSNKERGG